MQVCVSPWRHTKGASYVSLVNAIETLSCDFVKP